MLTLQIPKALNQLPVSLQTLEQAALCTREKEREKQKRPAHLAGSFLPAPACARRGSGGGGGGAAAAGLPTVEVAAS
ncbi:hypothetical protein CSHISOI_04759 [Colletotrichum shisoi]|uniref:Uncharacterized protein n=1 Tax=Colletotrichum shisoi TaxID=2078593 RepID=A0A5Q4BWI5_9PEZI|nr:hypothetical protein CSHISOI_04759 [Colletotrichum shisoi]